jgi:DNA-binding response OmpR family regulator
MDDAEKTILLIDDDREIAATIQSVLTHAGYRVHLASNGVEGQRMIESLQPDLIVTDMMMPKMGGFPVLEFLKTLEQRPKVIMITANEGSRHKAYAEMLGVSDYLRKPFPMEMLLESVRKALAAPEPEGKPAKRGTRKKG